jgi:hypothetical protein
MKWRDYAGLPETPENLQPVAQYPVGILLTARRHDASPAP